MRKSYNALQQQALVLAGCCLGMLLLGCFIIWYRIIFSKSIVSVSDASLYGQLEVIGVIPKF